MARWILGDVRLDCAHAHPTSGCRDSRFRQGDGGTPGDRKLGNVAGMARNQLEHEIFLCATLTGNHREPVASSTACRKDSCESRGTQEHGNYIEV